MKKSCFAYKNGLKQCSALLVADCNGCRFYKTKEQYREDLKQLSNSGKYYSPSK